MNHEQQNQQGSELRYEDICFDFSLDATDTRVGDETKPLLIGQPRAIRALALGTSIQAPGYNIFVTGEAGTGRTTAVQKILSRTVLQKTLTDLVFVYNFENPDSPRLIHLKQGTAPLFKEKIHNLVEDLKQVIKAVLTSESYKSQRDTLLKGAETAENAQLEQFEVKARQEGFQIVTLDDEDKTTDLMPLVEGQPVSLASLEATVTAEQWQKIREDYYSLSEDLAELYGHLKDGRDKVETEIERLKIKAVKRSIHHLVTRIRKKFPLEKVIGYLESLETDACQNLHLFLSDKPIQDAMGNPALIRYGVNVLVTRGTQKSLPLVNENRPTPQALLGTIESRLEPSGETRTSFMMIRAGSLIQASGGYLVLRAEEVFSQEENWAALKQALKSGFAEISTAAHPFGPVSAGIKPEPIDIDVKVIIIGPQGYYDLMAQEDKEFGRLFKISAELDSVMDRTPQTTREYLIFMNHNVAERKLLPLDDSGRKEVLEYGIRLAEHRDKLSTRFSAISDLLCESSYWAQELGLEVINRDAVVRARNERDYLFSLPEEKMDEQVTGGQILLETQGLAVGQVNGLAVLDRGTYSFGRPMRITATASPGDEGIVNIDGEAGLSGEIHNKGVLILEGLLKSRFAKDFPLALSAAVCFEQNYGGVDGDSASSTEVYALISAITGVPLRQDLAVSGSINQMGQIQPVGGITEKVEGFFHTCSMGGLSGTQGVIIPYWNIQNLVLSREVQVAVGEGLFHIYPIKTLEEGIFLLTGVELGVPDPDGLHPKGSLGYIIARKLKKMRNSVQPKN